MMKELDEKLSSHNFSWQQMSVPNFIGNSYDSCQDILPPKTQISPSYINFKIKMDDMRGLKSEAKASWSLPGGRVQ